MVYVYLVHLPRFSCVGFFRLLVSEPCRLHMPVHSPPEPRSSIADFAMRAPSGSEIGSRCARNVDTMEIASSIQPGTSTARRFILYIVSIVKKQRQPHQQQQRV